ncbi:MAG: hypothetical protein KY434_04605 [Actinobacteria bacterium]|nr:hypothetical protein [Actinomycetota bacterium]
MRRADRATPPEPAYGPGGYLPDRAARRARKIVLRSRMGLGWPVAALLAAALVAAAGAVFLATRAGPPGPPLVPVAPVDAVDPRGASVLRAPDGRRVLVVRAGGGVRAFAAPEAAVAWCPASGRLESARSVWDSGGSLLGGPGRSLRPLPAQVFAGRLYVDLTSRSSRSLARPPARPAGARPVCGRQRRIIGA